MRRNNMGKKYLDTKTYTLEASVMDVWENLEEEEQNFEAVVREGMKKLDPVGQADDDIDNDGDEDETDAYLKNRRKAIGRAMKGKKNLKANYGMMRANYGMGEDVDLEEGTKQVLAHGGKGKYKVTKDGDTIEIKFGGKVVGTADFDRGADSFFVSIKGEKGQKSFDDAQAIADYFAKNKITEEDELEKQHEMRMYDMKDAVRKVWEASDREKIENKREKSVKAKPGKTMTGDDMSEIEINPKIKG